MVRITRGEALAREQKAMAEVTRELGKLQRLTLAQLQAKHEALFRKTARTRNLVFLRKKLAWRIQELAEGGLSLAAQERIQDLMPEALTGTTRRKKSKPALKPAPRPSGRDPRLPPAGTIIERIYQGDTFRVEVLTTGFRFRSRTHRSLSAIAKLITGTSWNGFLFFGLMSGKDGHAR